ncbi:ADP-dependent NAD(P)H-hydrate dehydratase [Nocardioides pyridinolyticus]
MSADAEVVTPALLRSWPLDEPGAGKEARGELLVLGGSASTPGAALLAGEASLRAGAGKLVIATARTVAAPTAVAVPEARVVGLAAHDDGSITAGAADAVAHLAAGSAAVLAGPGLVDADRAVALLGDALGTAYLTAEHALTAARDLASRCGAVVPAGGTCKYVAAPDGRAWVVEGGGPGLGVSGSGDVQAGIVAGLLARGEEPARAAVWGAYLHARAGERLAGSVGQVGYLARELPGTVPTVLGELR